MERLEYINIMCKDRCIRRAASDVAVGPSITSPRCLWTPDFQCQLEHTKQYLELTDMLPITLMKGVYKSGACWCCSWQYCGRCDNTRSCPRSYQYHCPKATVNNLRDHGSVHWKTLSFTSLCGGYPCSTCSKAWKCRGRKVGEQRRKVNNRYCR